MVAEENQELTEIMHESPICHQKYLAPFQTTPKRLDGAPRFFKGPNLFLQQISAKYQKYFCSGF
uniref:Uncharacterized protein n=1 Tax=Oryza brachyantha TaxID=4533 RepID=J3KVG1_ORYBR